ncbi:hypothetical protein MKK88_09385 [Methylobacterium sp. E-005]|nr:hypothetical protein [Methylobacterium sp. E-005]
MTEQRTLRRRGFRLFGSRRGLFPRETAGPDISPACRTAGNGLVRGWLEGVVASFAYGGCLHNIHPDYIDFLHDLNRKTPL